MCVKEAIVKLENGGFIICPDAIEILSEVDSVSEIHYSGDHVSIIGPCKGFKAGVIILHIYSDGHYSRGFCICWG